MTDIRFSAARRNHLGLLADARHVLSMSSRLDALPVLTADDRRSIQQAKAMAWSIIAETVEELVSVLDVAAGDPDLEETGVEDSFMDHGDGDAPGCPIADPGGCEHDGHEPEYEH